MVINFFISEINDRNNTAQSEILADFRQVWHEAMTGQTIPFSQLWDFLPS